MGAVIKVIYKRIGKYYFLVVRRSLNMAIISGIPECTLESSSIDEAVGAKLILQRSIL
jgi:hypothetical protein